ncbi:MAG: hypothetical protein IPO35_00540 [Uliginosibacterium sp.]|nr:hypothetical protein [Uliginosibacterium sp.]
MPETSPNSASRRQLSRKGLTLRAHGIFLIVQAGKRQAGGQQNAEHDCGHHMPQKHPRLECPSLFS